VASAQIEITERGGIAGTLLAARSGLLQAMHPDVSAALVAQPDFFERTWPRLLAAASAPPEPGDPVWDRAGADAHFWAQAVRFDTALVGADLLGRPLTATEQERSYEETMARAGLPKPPPATLHEFRGYWHQMLDEVIEPTEAVLAALRPEAELPSPSGLRGAAWWTVRPLLGGAPVRLARGLLPPQARARLGLGWSAADERALDAVFALLRLAG